MSKRKAPDGESQSKKPKILNGHWASGLIKTMQDPKYIVKSDDLITIIKDMYPKAQHHYLVLPKENISNLKALNKNHVKLLKHMDKVARELINDDEHKGGNFKFGYHAEASMFRLHLHVISDDMKSDCLKSKKHWNSFTTDFFMDSKDIIKSLETTGKVDLPSKDTCKKYMNLPLKCHKCDYEPKNMPDLKKHILNHLK